MVYRSLLFWLTLLSAVAFFWPAIVGPQYFDPFVASRPALSYLIITTMFTLGALLPREELDQVRQRWPVVLAGTAVQYVAMPALAYLTAKVAGLSGPEFLGVVVVGCVPGAMASNMLTLHAGGNVSYSVSLTTMATLLSPLVVPLALSATVGRHAELDAWRTGKELLLVVVGPVVLGHLASRMLPVVYSVARRIGPVLTGGVIAWIIAMVVGLNRERLADVTPLLVGVLAAINLLGYLAGWGAGKTLRLPDGMRRALTLEVGMQNAGLGTFLVLELFPDVPEATIPTAAYTFGCAASGTLLAEWWSRRNRNGTGDRDDASGTSTQSNET